MARELNEILEELKIEDRAAVVSKLALERKKARDYKASSRMIHDLLVDMIQIENLDQLVANISTRVAGNRLPYDCFSISFLENVDGVDVLAATEVYNPNQTADEKGRSIAEYRVPINDEGNGSIGRKVVETGKTAYHEIKPGETPKLKNIGMASYVTAPITIDGRVIGTISLGQKGTRNSRESAIGDAEDIAAIVSSSIDRFKRTQSLEKMAEHAVNLDFYQGSDGKFGLVTPSVTTVLGYTEQDFMDGLTFDALLPTLTSGTRLSADQIKRNREQFEKMYSCSQPDHANQKFKFWLITNGELTKEEGKYSVKGGKAALVSMQYNTDWDHGRVLGVVGTLVNESQMTQGLLPICAQCHAVRDDIGVEYGKGEWVDFSVYLAQVSGNQISHGYCEGCAEEAMSKLDSIYILADNPEQNRLGMGIVKTLDRREPYIPISELAILIGEDGGHQVWEGAAELQDLLSMGLLKTENGTYVSLNDRQVKKV